MIMALGMEGDNVLNHSSNIMFTAEMCAIKVSGCFTPQIQSVVKRSVGPYSLRERLALQGDTVSGVWSKTYREPAQSSRLKRLPKLRANSH